VGMETDILEKTKINGAGLDLFTCSIVRVVAAGEGRKWRVVDSWVGGAREEGPCVSSLVRSADRACEMGSTAVVLARVARGFGWFSLIGHWDCEWPFVCCVCRRPGAGGARPRTGPRRVRGRVGCLPAADRRVEGRVLNGRGCGCSVPACAGGLWIWWGGGLRKEKFRASCGHVRGGPFQERGLD